MKLPKNLALRHVYNRLSKPSFRAQRNYQRFLGKMVSKAVKRQIPTLELPKYYNSNYYVRVGNTIVLYADDAYFKLFSNAPDNPNVWQHHMPKEYLYLSKKQL